jgi:hypothetical protein
MPPPISLETKVLWRLRHILLADADVLAEVTQGAEVKGYVTSPATDIDLIAPSTLVIRGVPARDRMTRHLSLKGTRLTHAEILWYQWPHGHALKPDEISTVDWVARLEQLIRAGDDGKVGKLIDPANVGHVNPQLRFLTQRLENLARPSYGPENIGTAAEPVIVERASLIASYDLTHIDVTTGKRQGEI